MKPPDFWNETHGRAAAPLTRTLLTPFSWLYQAVARWRYHQIVPTRLSVPVICVGNISMGGVGKTPLAMRIAKILMKQGLRPAFLSRGYGGLESGPIEVDPVKHGYQHVGDEPVLLAKIAPTYVGRDRVASAQLAIKAGVDILIMDDGFQNPTLKKDLSILVVDAGIGHGNGRIFPAGPLRETVATAMKRADAVVLIGAGDVPELSGFTGPILRAHLKARLAVPTTELVAFAGIGRPAKFFDHLRDMGCKLVQEIAFADHHVYGSADVKNLLAWKTKNVQLITTEKDWVRLPTAMQEQVLVWPVDLIFENPKGLDQVLGKVVPR